MDQLLDKSFDFSIRIMELAKYLDEERKPYPLSSRLLTCAAGIGISLRLAGLTGRRSAESLEQALSCAVESEYLLEIMVKTDCLQERQSIPILSDCRVLKELIAEQLSRKNQK